VPRKVSASLDARGHPDRGARDRPLSFPGFAPDWPAPANVRAWQTVRAGGVSGGSYSGLNLATHVGDSPAAVRENRARLSDQLGLPTTPAYLEQIHGHRIVDLDSHWLLCDRDGTRVGAAHAGWRGLAAGVLPAAIKALGCEPSAAIAWLGPAIAQAAYEVGDEVRDIFVSNDAKTASAFEANSRGRWQADLYALAKASLASVGVIAVYGGQHCTYAEAEQFFSHRREAPCGRMVSLIWLS
jgi:copper oxidase (laccase) domain-containing protein